MGYGRPVERQCSDTRLTLKEYNSKNLYGSLELISKILYLSYGYDVLNGSTQEPIIVWDFKFSRTLHRKVSINLTAFMDGRVDMGD
jgi:hypothetical protein